MILLKPVCTFDGVQMGVCTSFFSSDFGAELLSPSSQTGHTFLECRWRSALHFELGFRHGTAQLTWIMPDSLHVWWSADGGLHSVLRPDLGVELLS